jgi:SSS family solute:Na+ symporter
MREVCQSEARRARKTQRALGLEFASVCVMFRRGFYMETIFHTSDYVVFFGLLLAVMAVGLWVGRKDGDSTQNYFLAGKDAPWWAVAGSIFGSNVSANHMAGMMAVGFGAGFAISHLEITAIAGLLLLCYFFLPVYRKLHIFTLSEYLAKRFDDRSRVAYSVIMIVIIVLVMMLPAFYLGSRAVNVLLVDKSEIEQAQYSSRLERGTIDTEEEPEHKWQQKIQQVKARLDAIHIATEAHPLVEKTYQAAWAELYPGERQISLDSAEKTVVAERKELREEWKKSKRVEIDRSLYIWGILIMALVTGAYTIVGGLRAVIITDVIQSALILLGMLIVAWCTFNHVDIGGWSGMMELDRLYTETGDMLPAATRGNDLMHLYKPSDDPRYPWTGMLSGLLVLHIYYWGANQFIVQRALAARSLKDARAGIITAGFFKLLIPFVSIGTGIAAYYLFQKQMPGVHLAADTAFPMLVREVVAPLAIPGLVGLVAAGLIGAILSSVDSMMNSAATLITFDGYKRYVNPKASEEQLVKLGKIIIGVLVLGSAGLTILIFDPNTDKPFLIYVIENQSKLVAGIVAAFLLGMLWKGATPTGGFVAIITGVVVSFGLPVLYQSVAAGDGTMAKEMLRWLGPELNTFHTVFVAFVCALLANLIASKLSQHDEGKSKFTFTGLNIIKPADLQHFGMKLIGSLLIFTMLAVLMTANILAPASAGILAAIWTFMMFLDSLFKVILAAAVKGRAYSLLREDRFWAGLLASCAMFMMYYFK